MLDLIARSAFASGLIFAAVFSGEAAADSGAALYAQSCERCHADARALATSVRGRTTADVAASLEGFLSHHHTDSDAERNQIVDYLTGLRG